MPLEPVFLPGLTVPMIAGLKRVGGGAVQSGHSQCDDNASPNCATRIAGAGVGIAFDGTGTVELPGRHASIDPTDKKPSPMLGGLA